MDEHTGREDWDAAFPMVTTDIYGGPWSAAGYTRGFEVGIVVGYLGAINEHVPAKADRPPFLRNVPLTELPVLDLAASYLGYQLMVPDGAAEEAVDPAVDPSRRVLVQFRYIGNKPITPEDIIGDLDDL